MHSYIRFLVVYPSPSICCASLCAFGDVTYASGYEDSGDGDAVFLLGNLNIMQGRLYGRLGSEP